MDSRAYNEQSVVTRPLTCIRDGHAMCGVQVSWGADTIHEKTRPRASDLCMHMLTVPDDRTFLKRLITQYEEDPEYRVENGAASYADVSRPFAVVLRLIDWQQS